MNNTIQKLKIAENECYEINDARFDGGSDQTSFIQSKQENEVDSSFSHVTMFGKGLKATNSNQRVEGQYNKEKESADTNNYIHIIGNGTDNENRSNAYTLTDKGDATFAGDIKAKGATFDGDIEVKAATFDGDIEAKAATFNGDIEAKAAIFDGDIEAKAATFTGDVNVTGSKFLAENTYIEAKGVTVCYGTSLPENNNALSDAPIGTLYIYIPTTTS